MLIHIPKTRSHTGCQRAYEEGVEGQEYGEGRKLRPHLEGSRGEGRWSWRGGYDCIARRERGGWSEDIGRRGK